jgi:hypothetical protein
MADYQFTANLCGVVKASPLRTSPKELSAILSRLFQKAVQEINLNGGNGSTLDAINIVVTDPFDAENKHSHSSIKAE